jgi:hypothetical protein
MTVEATANCSLAHRWIITREVGPGASRNECGIYRVCAHVVKRNLVEGVIVREPPN